MQLFAEHSVLEGSCLPSAPLCLLLIFKPHWRDVSQVYLFHNTHLGVFSPKSFFRNSCLYKPRGYAHCQVQLPHLSLPSLTFSDCSATPVWSPSFAVSLLPLTSLTASHHLYPTSLKQGSPQELPLPPAFLLNVVSIFLNDMKRDFNYFHWQFFYNNIFAFNQAYILQTIKGEFQNKTLCSRQICTWSGHLHTVQKESPILLGYALVESFEKHFPRESNTHFSSCNRIYCFSPFLLPLFTPYSIKLNLDVSTLSLAIVTNPQGEPLLFGC